MSSADGSNGKSSQIKKTTIWYNSINMVFNDEIKNVREESRLVKEEIKKQSFGYILTALGLVAGLAWNQAISAFIQEVFPVNSSGLLAKFIYAVIVTILVVVLSKVLLRISDSSLNRN